MATISKIETTVRLRQNPTKSDELAALRAFVDSLPSDSYLAEIMRDAESTIAEQIRNDLAFPIGPTIAQICAWQTQERRGLEELRDQLARTLEELRTAEKARDRARQELAELAGCARQILKISA